MINLSEIEAKHERELARTLKIEAKEIQTIKGKYDRERRDIDQEYHQNASNQLIGDLRTSYEILQSRSVLAEIPEEEVIRIREAYKRLESIEDENTRKAIIDFSMAIIPEIERQKVLSLIGTGLSSTHLDISSYIAENGKDSCYLLAPVDGSDKKSLVKNLEEKLGLVLGECRVNLGKMDYDASKGVVSSTVKNLSIEFEPDNELVNGFLMYTLIVGNDYSEKLAKCLLNKLNNKEMQPLGFREARLRHIVEQIPYNILDYFMTHKIEAPPISRTSTDETHYRRRNTGLRFSSTDFSGRREEALERLNKLGDTITIMEAQEVLGHNRSNATYKILETFKTKGFEKNKRGKDRIVVSKSELEKFIQTHTPFGTGWQAPEY